MPQPPILAFAGNPAQAAQPASIKSRLRALVRKLAAMHRARQDAAIARIVRSGLAAID